MAVWYVGLLEFTITGATKPEHGSLREALVGTMNQGREDAAKGRYIPVGMVDRLDGVIHLLENYFRDTVETGQSSASRHIRLSCVARKTHHTEPQGEI
jgi:hypothetical protein